MGVVSIGVAVPNFDAPPLERRGSGKRSCHCQKIWNVLDPRCWSYNVASTIAWERANAS